MRHFLILTLMTVAWPPLQAQNLKTALSDYFTTYQYEDAKTDKCKVKSIVIDDSLRTILITGLDGFQEQHFTESQVSAIYAEVRRLAADCGYEDYTISVVTEGKPIEELVPNQLRTHDLDTTRLWKNHHEGASWVRNASRPYDIAKGLDNTHIAVWQSHGQYYDDKKGWKWQRPRLFCSVEDLLSQTFVIPYIIPMLENAGAIVFTPRERDWQNHECVVDNDTPRKGGSYQEENGSSGTVSWSDTEQAGFAHLKTTYRGFDNPFTDGTARFSPTTAVGEPSASIRWTPDIPVTGEYAVYVAYQTLPQSVSDAHYAVHHAGGITEVRVNQRMGGGTWVYVGTYLFRRGVQADGYVSLTTESGESGVVTADGVRFGGGMGNVERGGGVSGFPRWAEAARYQAQWSGFTKDIYSPYNGENDYRDDIFTRPNVVNLLSGGSIYNTQTSDGGNVPFELSIAFHTDAGFRRDDTVFGSLAISTTDYNDGLTGAGVDRFASYDLASAFLTHLAADLKKYDWAVRKLWNRNYIETREPLLPANILEMLSHQNFHDMELAFDPHFKFDFCRSVYKTIVKHIATSHQRPYVIQPLPVHAFSAELHPSDNSVSLTWQPTDDPSEPTAQAKRYVVFTRMRDGGFDNGQVVDEPRLTVSLQPDVVYSFRVCALNEGGISFPSETLCASIGRPEDRHILVVNAFDRLSGPASFNKASTQGFDMEQDPGVPYGRFAGFCGPQRSFDKANIGSESTSGLGWSSSELEGKVLMGNTFDYPYVHGSAIRQCGSRHISSMSEEAFLQYAQTHGLENFDMIDIIYGVQTDMKGETSFWLDQYARGGGKVMISGSNLFKHDGISIPTLHATMKGDLLGTDSHSLSGSGLHATIARGLNETTYAVPAPETLEAVAPAFPMLLYDTDDYAAVAYKEDNKGCITLGFPFESILEQEERTKLMTAILGFLIP